MSFLLLTSHDTVVQQAHVPAASSMTCVEKSGVPARSNTQVYAVWGGDPFKQPAWHQQHHQLAVPWELPVSWDRRLHSVATLGTLGTLPE
jgi:hypothetical protein